MLRFLRPAVVVLFAIILTCPLPAEVSEHANTSPIVHSSSGGDDSRLVDFVHKAAWLKRSLDDKGFSANLTFVNDWSKNFRGGETSAGSINRYSLDVSVSLDTKKSIGWNGGTGFFRLKNHLGENGSNYVGDAQGFSNIDDDSRTRLYELWYEQRLGEDRVRFKAGKIDANADFAVVKAGSDFLNSSMGYSPTIMALPTYPEPKPGVNVFVVPRQHYLVSAGWFRAAGDLDMLIVEGEREWQVSHTGLDGRFSLGTWRLTGAIPCFDGDELGSTQGFYVVAEQSIWSRPRPEPAGEQRLSLFLQYGNASGDVSRFTRHLGAGFVLNGPLNSRSHDAFGMAATTVQFTPIPDAGFQYHSELATEAYYKLTLGRYFSLVPDLQLIHHPGGLLTQKDAVVLTPRVNISF